MFDISWNYQFKGWSGLFFNIFSSVKLNNERLTDACGHIDGHA